MGNNYRLPPLKSAEHLGKFIYETYVEPARERGEKVVTIHVDDVTEALHYVQSPNQIRGVLGSMKFRNTYRLPLLATDELTNGQASTFTFRLRLPRPQPLTQ
jgi:hypothetical protein